MKYRPIAIYLPQFHPVSDNDTWWGKGFTEWTNVVQGKPLFKGHHQPHLPTDLGFYDLRLSETREDQARLAAEYGIYGFCYYHYWFNGRRILDRPFQEVFESGNPDFPFMLCWANENWTRVWDGGEKNVLLGQEYTIEDHRQHLTHLLPYFKDERYIRINGKPVFAVYNSTQIPDLPAVLKLWREIAREQGIELYLTRFETHGDIGAEYVNVGFDAAVEFQPHVALRHKPSKTLKDGISLKTLSKSIKYRANKIFEKHVHKIDGHIFEYDKMVADDLADPAATERYKRYPGVCVGFDNSVRRKTNYTIIKNSTPELFGKWLRAKVERFQPYSTQENLFFINAWNEWAEGNHLEPDTKWGRHYLEAVKEVFKEK